jgi:adhesin transport system outer membrane protein
LLDLLDSENELYQANRALISAKHDQLYAAYKVLATMGMFVDQFETGVTKK